MCDGTDGLQSDWLLICLFRPVLLLLCLSFQSIPGSICVPSIHTQTCSLCQQTLNPAFSLDLGPLLCQHRKPVQSVLLIIIAEAPWRRHDAIHQSSSVFPAGLHSPTGHFHSGGYGSVEQQSIASCSSASVVTSLWPCGHAVHQMNFQLSHVGVREGSVPSEGGFSLWMGRKMRQRLRRLSPHNERNNWTGIPNFTARFVWGMMGNPFLCFWSPGWKYLSGDTDHRRFTFFSATRKNELKSYSCSFH